MAEEKKELIKIRGANEHNLKNLDVDIPRNKLVVLTGLSGSGKSSLALGVLNLCRGTKTIYGISVFLRKTVPWADGEAECRKY